MDLWTSTDLDAFTALVWFGAAVEEHGLESPSLRTIASGHCSPGSLINWFGRKAELHRRVVRTLGVKWGYTLSASLVPVTDPDRFYARLRLAYEELARTDPAVGAELDELMKLERDAIAWWLQWTHERKIGTVDERIITLLHALLLRLWDVRIYPDPQAALALLEDIINAWFGKPVIEHPYVRPAG